MNKSFTLIEILVIIVVIGILSAFVLVGMSSITDSANIAKGKAFDNSLRNSLLMNLISEWKLDGGTIGSSAGVSDVIDSWGTNNATNIYTPPGPLVKGGTDCVSGKCLSFDGTNDYINCGNGISLNFGANNFTLSLWVKTAIAPSTPGVAVLSKTGGTNYWIFYITRDTSYTEFYFYVPPAPADRQLFSNAYDKIGDGKWHLVTLVENYGVNGILYIDGKYHATSTTIFTSLDDAASSFYISTATYNGSLDEIRVYKAALSQTQIQNNYFVGLNNLYKNKGITLNEFNQRIVELKTNLVKNE